MILLDASRCTRLLISLLLAGVFCQYNLLFITATQPPVNKPELTQEQNALLQRYPSFDITFLPEHQPDTPEMAQQLYTVLDSIQSLASTTKLPQNTPMTATQIISMLYLYRALYSNNTQEDYYKFTKNLAGEIHAKPIKTTELQNLLYLINYIYQEQITVEGQVQTITNLAANATPLLQQLTFTTGEQLIKTLAPFQTAMSLHPLNLLLSHVDLKVYSLNEPVERTAQPANERHIAVNLQVGNNNIDTGISTPEPILTPAKIAIGFADTAILMVHLTTTEQSAQTQGLHQFLQDLTQSTNLPGYPNFQYRFIPSTPNPADTTQSTPTRNSYMKTAINVIFITGSLVFSIIFSAFSGIIVLPMIFLGLSIFMQLNTRTRGIDETKLHISIFAILVLTVFVIFTNITTVNPIISPVSANYNHNIIQKAVYLICTFGSIFVCFASILFYAQRRKVSLPMKNILRVILLTISLPFIFAIPLCTVFSLPTVATIATQTIIPLCGATLFFSSAILAQHSNTSGSDRKSRAIKKTLDYATLILSITSIILIAVLVFQTHIFDSIIPSLSKTTPVPQSTPSNV
ncbi:hypothetical protein NEHOM01_1404 [Nematocida homosporus]|uniref:uncharacterized protein n=1 Tax=Nematocida homosporus TaxID=1912981 RepID=UPI0022201554|nr:uncharacterized protein NEHOM01_1404 [Nematocida homosporus]KAI5186340.1 hypothetical protein NEHOM01_1404 [Nematocida homosporus]